MSDAAILNTELLEQERAIAELHQEGVWLPDPYQVGDRMEANRKAKAAKLAEAKANAEAAKATKPLEPPQAAPAEAMPAQPAQKPKRPRGRPQKNPLWLQEVANSYAQGLPLGRALRKAGVTDLSESQRKGIYRWKRFRQLVESHGGQ